MASLENLSDEQIRGLASLAKDLTDDPKTRRSFQKLVKEKKPEIIFPELEVDERVEAVRSEVLTQNEELRAELKNRDLQAQRERIQRELSTEYPDLKFEDIEQTMVEHAIGSHKSAARFLANERTLAQPAPEVPGRGGPMMMPTEARQFFKSPAQTARKLAHEVVTDLVNKRNRARAGV